MCQGGGREPESQRTREPGSQERRTRPQMGADERRWGAVWGCQRLPALPTGRQAVGRDGEGISGCCRGLYDGGDGKRKGVAGIRPAD